MKLKTQKIFRYLLPLLCFIAASIPAQDLSYKKPFFLNMSIGGSPDYFSTGFSYNKVLDNFSYQIGLSGSVDHFFSRKGMTTVNFNAGYSEVRNWLFAFVNIGPSVSYGEGSTPDHRNVNFWGAGINFNAQAYFMPLHELFPGVGIGIELYYNFNVMQTKDVNYRGVYAIKIGGCLTDLHIPE